MFGRRPDARLVTDLAPVRRILPHVSPRRNDSVFHLEQQVDVEAALEFLDKHNLSRPSDRPATLFHLLLRSLSQGFVLRPGVNRFVKGGRLWEHDSIQLTFSAKRELVDGSPLLILKRRCDPEHESLDDLVDDVYARLLPARDGEVLTSDREASLLVRLPAFLTAWLVRGADWLDHFGLLPRALIEPDPHFTSLFVANLGSVGHDAGFHHLWERGTCSSFCVMGRVQPGPSGRRRVKLCWTYDERIEDGLYSYGYTNGVQERLERPELLLEPPSALDDATPT
ncbi:MAG: hypothetical protein AAF430_09810 [Myxococcota bacterium]